MSYERRLQLNPLAIIDGHAGRNQDYLRVWEEFVESKSSVRAPFPPDLSGRLLRRIADPRNLDLAWAYLMRRGGQAPGSDGVTYQGWSSHERWDLWRAASHALKAGVYQPAKPKVIRKRKVGGDYREICLFNIVDRVAQRAVVQILQPILNPTFDAYSLGARPGRGRLSALAALEAIALRTNRRVLVLVDFRKAFDSIPKSRLMDVLKKRIPNRQVVDLLGRIVNSQPGAKGIPQGAPLSPLLMNLYTDQCVDRRWRGTHREQPLIRYVDNVCLMVHTMEQGRDLYAAFGDLVRPHGFTLKESVDDAVVDLGRTTPDWLGFRLIWAADQLIMRLPATWEADLHASLMECHREPDAVRRANAVIRGVVEEAGPALGELECCEFYRRVAAVAAACEFREIVSRDVFRLRCDRSYRRWRQIRLAAHRTEGLQPVKSSPPLQASGDKLGRGEFEIFSDGSCLIPQGIGGWGCVIRQRDKVNLIECSGGLRKTTNNRAELIAVIRGLQMTSPGSRVTIITDSEYVFGGIRERYRRWRRQGWRTSRGRPTSNRPLLETLLKLLDERTVDARWVPSHSGHAENELADELSVRAAKRLQQKIHRRP